MSAIAALPAHVARASDGIRPPDGVSAWRTVFDREQSAALDSFRSVKAPAFAPAATSSAPVAASSSSSGLAPIVAAAPGNARAAAASTNNLARGPLQAAVPAVPAGSAASPPRAPQQLPAGVMAWVDPKVAARDAAGTGEAIHAAPLAAMLGKWPWRKWHGMTGADGLHLWLRDAGVTPHDPALQRWLGDLQRTLAAAGTPLASFTLNGKACPVSSIALKGS